MAHRTLVCGLALLGACLPSPKLETRVVDPTPPIPAAAEPPKVEPVEQVVGPCRWQAGTLRCPNDIELDEVVDVQVGDGFLCALRTDTRVWCWGDDDEGQLGRGYLGGVSPRPAPVWQLTDVEEIAIAEHSACARLSTGERRCWGRVDGSTRMVASDPSQPPPERFGDGACRSGHPSELPRQLESLSGEPLLDLLAELGLDPRDPELLPEPEPWIFPSVLERAGVREIDLDTDANPEWIVEVVLTAENPDHHRRFMAEVFDQDGAGRWCPLLGPNALSESNNRERTPADVHDASKLREPIELDFLELTAAGHFVIRERRQTGYVGHYPFRSEYTTSFWAFDGSKLVRIFGPFATYTEEHGDEWQTTTTGTLEIRGQGWPKSLVTKTKTCTDGEEVQRCKPTSTKKWVFSTDQYRPR